MLPFGKLGILAWLQSVVLITPWLLFLLLDLHQYCGHPVLVGGFGWLYIWLGNRLRAAGQDAVLRGRATERLANSTQSKSNRKYTASAS